MGPQGLNIYMWASIRKCTQHKAGGHKYSPSGWQVPHPLYPSSSLIFFPGLQSIQPSDRAPTRWALLGGLAAALMPSDAPISPLAHLYIFSEESQEGMWELNTDLVTTQGRACWGLVACSFGNTAALEKSWSPISVETKIKVSQRQPEEKRDKIMHLCIGIWIQT